MAKSRTNPAMSKPASLDQGNAMSGRYPVRAAPLNPIQFDLELW